MTLDWNKLKPNFDVRGSFEELCCQLARYETVPQNSIFVRKAPPDAGIECYWQLPDKKEWGWQAKFFQSPPSDSQWQQIDDSVKTALNKHPRLTKYVICLPIDRNDSRQVNRKSFLDRWNEHLGKWRVWKSDVTFEFWGNFEIEERLSRQEHHGRHKYFFDKEFLTQQWFENHLSRAISSAGPRYTPKLNVELPIAKIFDVLGRTPDFYYNLKKNIPEITKQFKYACSVRARNSNDAKFNELGHKIDNIIHILKYADTLEQKSIDFQKIGVDSEDASKATQEIILKLEDKARYNRTKQKDPYTKVEDFDSELYHLRNLQRIFRKFMDWARSESCLVANKGVMLIKGDAGTGKTHLFCDVASNRIKSKWPTIILFGSHFSDGNPKTKILQDLDLHCTFEEFLGALECAAQINGSKAILMIDALNEGNGQQIWPQYLPDLLTTVSNYSWIGLAMSVRTSYEPVVIPEHLSSEQVSRFTHKGFGDRTEEATRIFFENNGIERPSVPLLVPEFSNPQFLLVLCKGLKEKGLTKIPRGLKGLTAVYEFFIDTINEKLSKINFLDYPSHKKIVQKGVDILSEHMANNNVRYLSYEEAEKYLVGIYPSTTQSKSLLHHLISEGILSQDLIRTKTGSQEVAVQFAYERLGDNLIVKNQLLNIKKDDLSKLFNKNGKLGKYFENNVSCMVHRGIIDAISIQIPEKYGIDIIELRSKFLDYDVVFESVLDSFMWRHPKSITKSSLVLIEKHVFKNRYYLNRFLKILLTISSDPEIPINAEYLHKKLIKQDLANRDYVWSTFLHYDYYEDNSIVRRYIEWGWNSDKSNIGKESLYLSSLILSWFLTSSNRFIRDKATKALVSLLTNHLEILRKVLKSFTKCNDPYVLERLYAVVYGCAMRNQEPNQIKELAMDVYSLVFKNKVPFPDISLRDYAKGVIDFALFLGIKLDINYDNVKPPYKSKWISSFPSKREINTLRKKSEGTPQVNNGGGEIFRSLCSMGDFGSYTLGMNSNSFDWSSVQLTSKRKSRETIFKEFENSITDKQKIAWSNYYVINTEKERFRRIEKQYRKKVFGFTFEDDEFDQVVVGAKTKLTKLLSNNQKVIFDKYVSEYVESLSDNHHNSNFDLHLFERWIIKRVFDLGWTKERFGQFDQFISNHWIDRTTDKPERIGKKYQWIAYNELLARVSDNFEMEGDFSNRRFREYIGPWQLIGGRDIDPSLTLSKTFETDDSYHSWWFPVIYDAWDSVENDVEWLQNTSDLPSFENIIETVKPSDGSVWLTLGGRYRLQQKTPPDQERYEIPRRDIWFHLCSYLVKKPKTNKLYEWTKKQNYQGIRLPEYDYTTETFLGELYWAPSVQQVIMHGEPFWVAKGDHFEDLPAEVYIPMYGYAQESGGYDCSIDEHIELLLPNKLLVEKMNLKNKVNGMFFDEKNELITFDPTATESGPGVLLANKNRLLKFLQENNYDIIWTLIGQKTILGGEPYIWKGDLEIYGTYRIIQDKLTGIIKTQFVNREIADKRNAERMKQRKLRSSGNT